MQACCIQPEIETALQEVARGRGEKKEKKKERHVNHSAKQRKSVYGGWEREIKTTDRPPAKRHKTLRHNAEADAAATKGTEQNIRESLPYISSSILKYSWLFSVSQTLVGFFQPGYRFLLHSGSGHHPSTSDMQFCLIPPPAKL